MVVNEQYTLPLVSLVLWNIFMMDRNPRCGLNCVHTLNLLQWFYFLSWLTV